MKLMLDDFTEEELKACIDKAYDEKFVQAAAEAGLVGISGYRLGGCRVSLYNAMPYEGVEALVDFMQKYEISHPL